MRTTRDRDWLRSALACAGAALALAGPARPARAQTPSPSPTASGPLQSITLGPAAATRAVGEAVNYTAIGTFQVGTKNLTQQVSYASSDPAVAEAPNAEGNRGRVNALAPGTATITATDPATQIVSNEATLTVLGALESLTLGPAKATREVGQTITFTATGTFQGGGTRNLTQRVVYASSDPSVAAALNLEGNKSLVEAVGVGTATISATDPQTEVSTSDTGGDATLTVIPGGPGPTPGCGDPDGNGTVDVIDAANVARAAVGLPSNCTPATCDVDGSGSTDVIDAANVARDAVGLPAVRACGGT
jgi:hypothetical protein